MTYIDNLLLTFIETPVFTEQITSLLDDDEYSGQVLLLTAYDKDHQSDLSASQKRLFREIIRKWQVN